MTAVLGASLGVSGIRAVSTDLSANPPHSTELFEPLPEQSDDPWGSVTRTVHRMAWANNVVDTPPVLALRDKNPVEAYGVEHADGLALVSDLGAQIGALQEAGDIAGEKTIALFDVGAGGVTMSVVDRHSGRVLASRRSAVLSGDGCDAALTAYLLGDARAVSDGPDDIRLIDAVCAAKEQLSTVTAVELHGPFASGGARVHRSEFDSLIRENVYDAVAMAASMIDESPRVDALYAVGGGANMQIVRQSLFDALAVPVFVPRDPELLASRGALGVARGLVADTRSIASPRPSDSGRPRHDDKPGRPRHSDTSSRRLMRLGKSRYLGGAVVALIAGGVAVSIASATSRPADDIPVSVPSRASTSSETASVGVAATTSIPRADADVLGGPAPSSVPASVPLPTRDNLGVIAQTSEPAVVDQPETTADRRRPSTAPSLLPDLTTKETTRKPEPTRTSTTSAPAATTPNPTTTTRPASITTSAKPAPAG